jgi:hypothetical protein
MVVFTVIMLAGKMKTISTGKEVRGIFMCLIALLVWTGISIFKSINTGDAFSEWLRLALMYSVFIVAYFLFQVSSNAITVLSRFVLIGNFIFGGYAIVQLVPQWSDYILQTPLHRSLVIPSSLANKNFFSEVLVLMLPALVYGIITERKWMKAIFILPFKVPHPFLHCNGFVFRKR